VSQENHNVYSKPSIVLLRSGKLIRLSLQSPDIVVVSPGGFRLHAKLESTRD